MSASRPAGSWATLALLLAAVAGDTATAVEGVARAATGVIAEPASLVGGWIGGYDLGGVRASIGIRIRAGTAAAVLRALVPAGDTTVVRVLAVDPGRVALVAGAGDSALRFEGRVSGGRMSGTVSRGPRRGRFELALTVPIHAERLQGFVGDYEVAPGRVLVMGRSLGQLFYLEPDEGRQGPLVATSESSFVAGPAIGTMYPLAASFRFARDAGGSVTGVWWRRGEEPERLAARSALYASTK